MIPNSKTLLGTLAILAGVVLGGPAVADDEVTRQQILDIEKSGEIIADVLFDHDLDDKAVYKVEDNGSVLITFAESVPEKTYTEVVEYLRTRPEIRMLWAWQGASEVCPYKN